MAFDANAGRILVTNASGQTRLDTDEALFHIVDTLSQGTESIPARTHAMPAGGVNETNDTLIGTCNSSCTHVIGAVKFSATAAFGIGYGRWTTYMGGDLIWVMEGKGLTAATASDMGFAPHTVVTYRFLVSSGNVYLRQHIRLPNMSLLVPGTSLTILAHTITHKLKCGLFT